MLLTLSLFSGMEQYLTQSFGSIYILALGIILLFTVGFMIAGIDFRLALLTDTILVIGFARMGWLPSYIEGIFWIGVVGLGLYIAWTYIGER